MCIDCMGKRSFEKVSSRICVQLVPLFSYMSQITINMIAFRHRAYGFKPYLKSSLTFLSFFLSLCGLRGRKRESKTMKMYIHY